MGRLNSIRKSIKKRFDEINNEAVKRNIMQGLPFWVGSAITGIVAVFYAYLFGWAEDFALFILHSNKWLMFITAPLFFYLGWYLVKRFAGTARGSGIPQVMASIELATPKNNFLVDRLLSFRIMCVKVASSILMVMGGGAIGREGPTIQIAGSVFRFVNNLIPESWPKVSKRNMIMTGAAAGLAAAFNTPLGGVVFAVEELSKGQFRHFRTALFSAVIIAGLTAQWLLGPYLYLGYPELNHLKWYIIFIVILVGVIAGIAGASMARFILKILKWRSGFSFKKQMFFLFGCAILMAGFGVFWGELAIGSGKEIMTETLFTDEKVVAWYTPILRIIGPAASFSAGGAGGIFAPSLGAGASIGSVMAGIFGITNENANILIMSGMVAFLTGVTRSPFTSAILVLEMTDRHSVIFHLMIAALLANLAAYIIDKKSFYDHLKEDYIKEVQTGQ